VDSDSAETVAVTGNTATSGDDENLTLMSIDKSSQEDARQITWKGLRPASVMLQSEFPQDLNTYFTQHSYLQFELKVNETPHGEVSMAMSCDQDCGQPLDITKYLSTLPSEEWLDVNIELQCFTGDKDSLSDITAAFVMHSTAAFDISVANIKLVPTKGNTQMPAPTIACSS